MDTTQLKRIADALEEILRLVKLDQAKTAERMKEYDNEQTSRASNGPRLPAALALAPGSGTKLQASSGKLQASSSGVDKGPVLCYRKLQEKES